MKPRSTVIVFAGVDGIVIDRQTRGVCRAASDAIDLIVAFRRVLTVGFGNRPSHLPFLRRMDVPVIVPTEDTAKTARMVASLPRARLVSPDGGGWACAILEAVERTAGDAFLPMPH